MVYSLRLLDRLSMRLSDGAEDITALAAVEERTHLLRPYAQHFAAAH